ncbi:hypothetical protein JHL17_11340 [Azospirillum sp. YIM B02556]|uniref:Uncharacterized protein n=1 Tax=Azospirillum endophyticum TaxID=2800326 RepID=A0ABS1F3Z2_9PROT|nr:hypothetical protein [Azospirillum endophyticum]MBK1838007.1 hypothetical protein [Azospirillum endophyticum]
MKIDPEHSRVDAARKPQDLRTMLLGSTTIPALGMTIAEASQKTADLLAENDGPGALTDEQADVLAAQWSALENAVTGAMPHTILDAASILDRIFPDDATHIPQRDIPALRRVATFLHQVVETARSASPDETSIIPSIGMTFRQAADRVRELLKRGSTELKDDPEDAAELERVEAERFSDAGEWSRIERAMLATPTQTVGDLLAKVERLACPELGICHLVFPDEEIALLEEDVQRLRQLWSGMVLSAPADGRHPDTALLALGRHRAELIQRIDQPARSGHEAAPLLIEWKEVDHLIMELTPKTGAGLAVQLAVIWRLLDAEPGEEDGPTADSTLDRVWLWTAMQNAQRIGLPDEEETTQDALTILYGQWVTVRARFLSDDLSDEESDVLEAELDQIEDRLASAPVRCVADAIAMLGYFLTASNAMLDDGILPSIDADGSTAWQRLLFVVEDAAELLAVDSQVPFRAMVAGLRHLMQRHVKLEEESDKQPGGRHDIDLFNAYDALLKAMRAESALPDSASDEEREPHEQAMEAAADHLVTLAPATPRGAAILLRYLFLRTCSTIEAERAFLRGDEPNEEGLTDYQSLILWRTVKMLEALPAAANDQHQEPDAFADTVAAFEAEAPATLALPQEPTGRMVDAGASAAGITPAQFQAAYAAAVEALKLERAA